MRKILLSLVAVMLLGSAVPMEAQRHRHTPRTAVVDDNKDDNGIEAYSDTSSTVQMADTAHSNAYSTPLSVDDSNRFDPDRFSDPFSWLAFLGTSGFVGILLTILLLGVGLLFLFMPLIIVLLIIRYLVRRHNERSYPHPDWRTAHQADKFPDSSHTPTRTRSFAFLRRKVQKYFFHAVFHLSKRHIFIRLKI